MRKLPFYGPHTACARIVAGAFANQPRILTNQRRIEANQAKLDKVIDNQKKLDRILANQKAILANQRMILKRVGK